MSPDELRPLAHRAMSLAPSPFLRHQKRGRHLARDGVAFTAQDYDGPSFNYAAVLGPSPPLDRIVQIGTEFFGKAPGPWGVLVEADAGHPVEAELRGRSWVIIEDEPALVLPAIPPPVPLPPGLEVYRVADEAGRSEMYATLAAGFEMPPGADEAFSLPLAAGLDPAVGWFVGRHEGRGVAGALLACVEGIATVHGVATVPAYRRRGFGRAVTWAAVQEGAARGCTTAALRALGVSFDMYRGMGFVHVCNHRTYAPPAAAAAR